MDLEFGNAGEVNTNDTGWFIGFSAWATGLRQMPKDLRSHTMHVKWMEHPAGDPRGIAKPPSEGRTISIFVSERGKFRIEFSPDERFADDQTQRYTLDRHGDFIIWGEDIHHRWFVDDDCVILTIRWIPVAGNE